MVYNDTPVITSTAVTSETQGIRYYYQVTATDTDGDVLCYQLQIAGYPVGMTISDTGSLYWTPTNEQVGR